MDFKKSKYYNKVLLGENLYNLISDNDEIFTVQEFFNINGEEKEYRKSTELEPLYILKIFDNYYELYSYSFISDGYIVFDKPVFIWGEYCNNIIAPEIIVKIYKNGDINYCVADKVTINNLYEDNYYISNSKISNLYFYNEGISLEKCEINNFFIFDDELIFDSDPVFLDYHKIKFFGECEDLNREISKNKKFKNGIIHIE